MLTIEDPELAQLANEPMPDHHWAHRLSQHPVLDLAFRSYFLLAVICSIVALSFWSAYLNGYFTFSAGGLSPTTWHIHEMLFGFAATVAVGFILTAAQTWTGKPSIKGLPLLTLIVIWLLVRVCLLINQPAYIYSAIALQTLWWFGSIIVFTRLVLSSQNRRNYIFIPLFIAMMLLNISLVVLDLHGDSELSRHVARTSVLMFCLLMGVLGGRVIPFFTVSGAKLEPITIPQWLTPLLTLVSLLGVLVFFSSGFVKLPFTPAGLMVASGLLHIFRQSYWRSKATVNIPLLWSLHLSYFSLGLGLILLGGSYQTFDSFTPFINFSHALHVITIAAMGLMIFAMMCRVSLGHTGRALIPNKLVPWIFFAIFLSAFTRVILPLFDLPLFALNSSAFLWLVAGVLFLKVYFPILISKKVEKNFR